MPGHAPQEETLDDYQAKAVATMKQHPNRDVALLYFSGALCGEAGEAFEVVKKHIRDGKPLDMEKLVKELGDTLWYLAAVCEIHGIKLSDVAATNIKKLAARYPTGQFNAKDSHRNREE